MRDEQPPITNDEEYRGYQKARDTMTALLAEREARLFEALKGGDATLIEDRRFGLLNTLRKRQGIIDAITTYERSRQQIA
ncbi:MAG TPA: hypothetical protein VHI51_01780 [Ktedonobacterales bacterium]|jgi:hypothetical protein|nr:hypothetical protein [Ktedonobacterales bacterium]